MCIETSHAITSNSKIKITITLEGKIIQEKLEKRLFYKEFNKTHLVALRAMWCTAQWGGSGVRHSARCGMGKVRHSTHWGGGEVRQCTVAMW